jgi:hypothetical protein
MRDEDTRFLASSASAGCTADLVTACAAAGRRDASRPPIGTAQ